MLPDGIPSAAKLFSKMFLAENREEFWRVFTKLIHSHPTRTPALFEMLANRAEGTPKHTVEVSEKRSTKFIGPGVPESLPEKPA